MDMFPYPSGEGLHVGHPLGFIGTDVFARYQRMRGENVLHTMGFDAFGLPAEQYAVQTGQHPAATTYSRIDVFKRQLRRMGLGHDQRRVFATTDKRYYRWTQWIFLQIFNSFYDYEANRARPITELVAELTSGAREPAPGTNPFGTPWADCRTSSVDRYRQAPAGLPRRIDRELVSRPGHRAVQRGGHERRAERAREFPGISQAAGAVDDAHHCLRRSAGRRPRPDRLAGQGAHHAAQLDRPVDRRASAIPFSCGDIEVFTTRPDTIFGATYMVLAPEHPMVAALTANEWPPDTDPTWTGSQPTPAEAVRAIRRPHRPRPSSTARRTSARPASSPARSRRIRRLASQIPVFIADYVLMGYGTGAIMAVPGQDERDWEFAEIHNLPIVRTVQPPEDFEGGPYLGDGPAIHSDFLDGLDVAGAKAAMITWLEKHGWGQGAVTYRLRDWLFSRQRYWGEPFPIVYDETDLPIALPESMLPVELPDTDDFSPRSYPPDDADSMPEPPLGRLTDWVTVTLDLGDGPRTYRRETNTMPNWAGSCWYELRYLDPTNDQALVDPRIERYWMGPDENRPLGGVDLYVGGVEHAVLHLLYARFWHKVLYDLGYVSSQEPFHRLVNQGYVQAYAYTDSRGAYVPAAEVVEKADGAEVTYTYDGEPVHREYGKMGKSLKNVTTPDEMYAAYGADTMRLFEMFTGPLEQDRPWDTKAVIGSFRLLQRIWRTVIDENTGIDPCVGRCAKRANRTPAAQDHRRGPRGVRNPAVQYLYRPHHRTEQPPHPDLSRWRRPSIGRRTARADACPAGTACGRGAVVSPGSSGVIGLARVPRGGSGPAGREDYRGAVQVNGKVRTVLSVPTGLDPDGLEAAARADTRVMAALDGREVRRVIVVPGRLVNFVV